MTKPTLPPVLVAKCDGVDSPHMPVILLDDFVGPGVPSDDLLVGCSDDKQVLLVIVRIELDAIADFFVGETAHALARLCVPQLDESERQNYGVSI